MIHLQGTFTFSSALSPIGDGGGKPSLAGDKLGGAGGKSSANDSSSGTFTFSSALSPIGGGGEALHLHSVFW